MNLIQFVILLFNSHFSLIVIVDNNNYKLRNQSFEKNDWFLGKAVSQIEIVM